MEKITKLPELVQALAQPIDAKGLETNLTTSLRHTKKTSPETLRALHVAARVRSDVQEIANAKGPEELTTAITHAVPWISHLANIDGLVPEVDVRSTATSIAPIAA